MNTSTEFRNCHVITRSIPILSQTQVSVPGDGWYQVESGPLDVLDLNGNGEADFTSKRVYKEPVEISVDEPAFGAPGYSALKEYAEGQGIEVLTQDDLPNGLFLKNVHVKDRGLGEEPERREILEPAAVLLNRQEPFDPKARFAIDFTANEFLIYSA